MTLRALVIPVALLVVSCKSPSPPEPIVGHAESVMEATEVVVDQTTIASKPSAPPVENVMKRIIAKAAPRASAKPPVVRRSETVVCCRLPTEMIARIVRSHFGDMRACYQDALKRDPAIAGKVMVGFTIQRNGSVTAVKDAGGDLADPATRSCVVSAFGRLTFPEPDGGPVNVTYPITFNPAS